MVFFKKLCDSVLWAHCPRQRLLLLPVLCLLQTLLQAPNSHQFVPRSVRNCCVCQEAISAALVESWGWFLAEEGEENKASRREGRLQDALVIHYCLVVLTDLEFLANRFLKDSSVNVAANTKAQWSWSCLISSPLNCLFCSVNQQQRGAPNVYQSNLENPQIPLSRDIMVPSPCPSSLLSTAAVLSLDERSRDSFCLCIAMLAQPLEKSACRRPPDPLKVCFRRKLRAGRQRAFFFLPLPPLLPR